jgi:hydroxyethylthiazole kinase-like uncharacterized protein yjeF
MRRIHPERSWFLHDTASSRELERLAQAELAPHTLMRRAGLAAARLAQALVPHGKQVWIACGPGNNGGDGFEAGCQLHQRGWSVHLSWTGATHSPADALASRQRALDAGLQVGQEPPAEFDLAIDALLGLGGELSAERPASALMLDWLERMHGSGRPVLALDLPTGLHADTGLASFTARGGPRHTLSLLTLKPGLLTGQGRDLAGDIWWDPLGVEISRVRPTARLLGADEAGAAPKVRAGHIGHKGLFGDVLVVGGEQLQEASMAGAALLAARAALRHGAGRVYVALLGQPDLRVDLEQPELMFRPASALRQLPAQQVIVVGCGGGQAVQQILPGLLRQEQRMVLDADALNAVAADAPLRRSLTRRGRAELGTVLTPHPLEAARLLSCSADQVQADRLRAAQTLAQEFACVVALKGSGTVIAAPGQLPVINATGNARLATAGTGDVLAGMVGSAMAQGLTPWAATLQAVHEHGARADDWARRCPERALTASQLMD